MNKKLISSIALLSIVAALTPLALNNYMGPTTTTYLLEADVSQDEVIDVSTLIVQGKIISSHVEKVKTSEESEHDTVFTVWKIKTDALHKDNDSKDSSNKSKGKDIITFKTVGGEISTGIESSTSLHQHKKHGDEVLVMLVKDPASIYGDNYYPVSYLQGVYTVEDGKAKSIEEKHNKNERDLIKKIKDRLN